MVTVGYLTGLIYTISLKDGVLIATYSAGLMLSSIILFGYYRYQ
jgi:inorganic pyrophosphatase/exopolyphosphatase